VRKEHVQEQYWMIGRSGS